MSAWPTAPHPALADIPLTALFVVLFVLLACSAFFSGSETALMALNRYRMRHMAQSGHRGALRAQRLLEKPDRLIGLILLGNNFVNILATQLATYLGYRLYGDVGIAIATGLLTLTLLLFAEVTPKTLGALHSERFAYPAARIYTPLLRIALPLVWVTNLIANGLLRALGVRVREIDQHALSSDELRSVVNEAGSLIPTKHQKMLVNILDLEKATVEDIMVPRHEIQGIDLEDEWDDIEQQLFMGSYTLMPVYRDNIDQVLGFIHVRNVLPLIYRDELNRETLREQLRDAYFIPEGTPLNRQLINFQRGRRRIGLVVDEYGDIQGLVTLEDLLEEIVGEFTTAPAALSPEVVPQEDGSWVVDGGVHLRELNRMIGARFRLDGPRTLNGLIIEHLESIPEAGTSVLIDGYPIEIIQVKNNAVKAARIGKRLPGHRASGEQEHA
jgi:Mg2+/Co2+ transporter CorB